MSTYSGLEVLFLIYTKRIVDPPHERDGWRVLVDATWRPESAPPCTEVDEQVRGFAPETTLVRSFATRPEQFALFAHRYRAQLRTLHPLPAAEALVRKARRHPVTLVYPGYDSISEPVFVLQAYLLMLLAARRYKARLRKGALLRRSRLSGADRAQKAGAATERLLSIPALQRAQRVALYLSIGDEADTWDMAQRLRARGVDVYVPKTMTAPPRLYWGALSPRFSKKHPVGLVPGPYRAIPEPVIASPAERVQPDVVIVPIVAFDSFGYRIGYGGGYYDRTLKVWPRALRVGLAFECQHVPQVPREPHDIPLDWIVTEVSARPFATPAG